jgi:hypothetical protein
VLEFTLRHDIDCSAERFWALFFDADFTRTMIVDGLGFARCDIEPLQERGDKRTRSMRVTPKIDVPAAVAKLLGPALAYTEEGTFLVSKELWTYTLRLSVLSDRIRIGGKVRIEPKEGDHCVRVSDIWVEAKILGLGGMVERAAEKNLREGWTKSSAWMNGWLAKNPSA